MLKQVHRVDPPALSRLPRRAVLALACALIGGAAGGACYQHIDLSLCGPLEHEEETIPPCTEASDAGAEDADADADAADDAPGDAD